MRRTNHRNLVNVGILSGRIPLISLVQFIAVAEHLNFRHAAKALGISQSSVSARVKALEDNLGVLLFERHARGVRLTDSVQLFDLHDQLFDVGGVLPLGQQPLFLAVELPQHLFVVEGPLLPRAQGD